MGGRRLSVQDPDRIVDDWPQKVDRGREARKREYQEARRAEAAEKAAERPAPALPCGCPGPACSFKSPLPSPEEYFPEWDFVLQPWGPPLDDPKVKAYCDIQWNAYLKHCGVRKHA